jgi:hypothetical protein
MAMYEDDEPSFWALVGNTKSSTWADAAVAYITFYHLFFKGIALERCVETMKEASGDGNFEWRSGKDAKAIYLTFIQQELDRMNLEIENAASMGQQEIRNSERATPNPGPQADG